MDGHHQIIIKGWHGTGLLSQAPVCIPGPRYVNSVGNRTWLHCIFFIFVFHKSYTVQHIYIFQRYILVFRFMIDQSFCRLLSFQVCCNKVPLWARLHRFHATMECWCLLFLAVSIKHVYLFCYEVLPRNQKFVSDLIAACPFTQDFRKLRVASILVLQTPLVLLDQMRIKGSHCS